MSDTNMDPLAILTAFNVLLPYAVQALQQGRQVTQEEVDAAAAQLGSDTASLQALINAKKAGG